MTAKNTKGVTICCTKGGVTATPLTITAVTKATVASDNRVHLAIASTTGLAVGDLVTIPAGGTGFSAIDSKAWTIGAVDATGIVLNGTKFAAGTLIASPVVRHYDAAAMICLCLSELKFNSEKGATISVSTFCDPSASIPSASTTAGTVDIGGFVDVSTTDYAEIVAAEADGNERIFRIMLPNNGEIVFPAVIASLGWDIPLDGAMAWTAQLALGSRPRHLY